MNLKTQPPLYKPTIKVKKPNAKGLSKKIFKRYSSIILYTLLISILIIGIIYLFGGDDYSLASYLWMQILVLIIATVHYVCSTRFFDWVRPISSWRSILFTLFISGIGVGLVFLSRHWEWLPTLPLSYSFAMILFFVPLVYMIAYGLFQSIPDKIFKPWVYPYGKEIPIVEVINPIKIKFYIAKKQEDDEYTEFALNVPHKYKLGEFMHYFIHRYNYDKNPEHPIYMSKDNSRKNLYQWLFKAKPASMTNRHIYDPDHSFIELGIKENDSIIVERYFANTQINKVNPEETVDEKHNETMDVLDSETVKTKKDGENL